MTRYFITGAQGVVGRHLVAHLLATDKSVEVLGVGRSLQSGAFTHRVSWGSLQVQAPLPSTLRVAMNAIRYRYVPIDLCRVSEMATVLGTFRPDMVIHLAAALRDDSPDSLFSSNVAATVGLFDALRTAGSPFPRVVLGSTGGVYGNPLALPIAEDATCNPIDLYAISKLEAERKARALGSQYGIPVICARLFNLVGPGQDERHACGRFAAKAAAMIEGLAARKIQVGALNTTRDFIDVRDAAAALAHLARIGATGSEYNIGSGIETPMRLVLEKTLNLAGLKGCVSVEQRGSRVADVPRHFARIDRIRSTGFQPRYDLQQSIRDLLEYYFEEVKASQFRSAS